MSRGPCSSTAPNHGTVMADSKLGYQVWALAIFLMTTNLKGVSSMMLHRDLGITQKSAWHLEHRIREAFRLDDAPPPMDGPVEVDESFFGGKEANKHAKNKLRAGRGTVGKTAVVGVEDRGTGKVRAKVSGTTGPELKGFVQAQAPVAKVYSDEFPAYNGLPDHESVKHSVGEYVREQAHINGMESFWSMMKRGYHGIYHRMSPKHLDRYVGEYAGRQISGRPIPWRNWKRLRSAWRGGGCNTRN